jgi:ubiquinone/menaquinone biosynthesis C-methylase UbiE
MIEDNMGVIDGIHNGYITGWVSAEGEIMVQHEDQVLDTIAPDTPRFDVVAAGLSIDLNIGIRYPLNWEKLQYESLRFLYKKEHDWVEMQNSPISLEEVRENASRLNNFFTGPYIQLREIIRTGNDLTFIGIFIADFNEYTGDLTLKINGKDFDEIEWENPPEPTPYYFWYLPTQKTAFKAILRNAFINEKNSFRIQAFSSITGEPENSFRFIEVPNKALPKNLPDYYQQKRVAGWADNFKFWSTGFTHMRVIQELVNKYKPSIEWSSVNLLDFGCGCGRITRHFLEANQTLNRVVGVDIDKANIEWCKQNLAGGEFYATELEPPLPFTDETFDVITCNSVFTHLDEDKQVMWLKELSRILKPDGLAIVTINQGNAAAHGRWSNELLDEWTQTGIIVGTNNDLKGVISDDTYYQDVFLTTEYINTHWIPLMDIIGTHEMTFGYQNAVILKKKFLNDVKVSHVEK